MSSSLRANQESATNPLANPALKPVFDVLKKVVFKRDRHATQISQEDFKEALRFLKITKGDARKYLTKELGDLLKPATEEELQQLLVLDNGKQEKLRFDEESGRIFKTALQRFEGFLSLATMSGRHHLNHVFRTLFAEASCVPGQQAAAREAALQLSISLTDNTRKLPATLFLHGPQGAGNHEMSRKIASAMSGLGYAQLEVDLSQFRTEGEEASISGSKPYWTGSRAGIVTSFIYQHPKAVIVFHNMDRTLPRVLESLYQPLTTGFWVDQFGLDESEESPSHSKKRTPTTVDCREVTFIFNASEGSDWYQNPDYVKFIDSDFAKPMIIEAMRDATQHYRGESTPVFHGPVLDIVSDSLVLLKPAAWESLRATAKRNLLQACRNIGRRFSCQISVKNAQAIADLHLLRFGPAQGISACAAKSFEDGALSSFATWSVAKDAQAAVKLNMDERAIKALSDIIHDLGCDPIATLRRKGQSVRYSVGIEENDVTGVTFMLRDLDLQQTPRLKDFTGEIHIEAAVPAVGFADVAGHPEAKEFFREMIGYLRQPERVAETGVDLPKGALLYGPPGSGKTRLAQAFAGEAGMPFIAVTGADLLYPHRISELYRIAKRSAPCVIFIDEVDVIGKRGRQGSAHDTAINTLLTKVQGFSCAQPIFHIMATNRENSLDDALVRPGRIDRRFYCGSLSREGRSRMIERLLKVTRLEQKSTSKLLPLTYGMTGAEIEQIVRECGLRRLRLENDRPLNLDEVIDEINTVKFGAKRLVEGQNKTTTHRVALHEVGHALVLQLKNPHLPLEVITITPRNNSAGFVSLNTEHANARDETPDAVRNYLAGVLAGRAAEMIAYGNEGRSSGAMSDLSTATRAAWKAVAHAGLDAEMPIGSILAFSEFEELAPEPLRRMAWERTQHWLKEAESEATAVLHKHWSLVEYLTEQLLEKEHIDGSEFNDLIERFRTKNQETASTNTSQGELS
jgi:cell division protease FtsH